MSVLLVLLGVLVGVVLDVAVRWVRAEVWLYQNRRAYRRLYDRVDPAGRYAR